MRKTIIESLKNIEAEEKIAVLLACESGSRAWGTQSPNSDYDIRFIYIHHSDWYLQLFEQRDVFEKTIPPTIELVGWDLKKALKLLYNSNPSLLEWIHSPIIYRSDDAFLKKLKNLSQQFCSIPSLLYHYVHMAKKNFQSLNKERNRTPKRYINCIRPIMMCLSLLNGSGFPNGTIQELFLNNVDDKKLLAQFQSLLKVKSEEQHLFSSQELDKFIQESIFFLEDKMKKIHFRNKPNVDSLNNFFINMVKRYS